MDNYSVLMTYGTIFHARKMTDRLTPIINKIQEQEGWFTVRDIGLALMGKAYDVRKYDGNIWTEPYKARSMTAEITNLLRKMRSIDMVETKKEEITRTFIKEGTRHFDVDGKLIPETIRVRNRWRGIDEIPNPLLKYADQTITGEYETTVTSKITKYRLK